MLKPVKNILSKPYHLVKNILKKAPLSSNLSNFEGNREYWNKSAKHWTKNKYPIDNPDIGEKKRGCYIERIGDEWGNKSDVLRIVEEYIYPFITKESVVAEIGVGGARIAIKVADRIKELYCFDISSEMLKRAEAALGNFSHVSYVLLENSRFSQVFTGKFDFVYSFDVFVHLDLHTMWKYFNEIGTILKEGGKVFISTTNLKAPDGWKKFSKQDAYSFATHYFISPEIIDILAEHSNLRIIKRSIIDPTNYYLNRDYLVVLEKVTLR